MLLLLRSQARQAWFSNETDSPDPIEESVMYVRPLYLPRPGSDDDNPRQRR